ncbi:hypothetical protein GJA_3941 [Janthinobacterium agaricidamnosum NBRC 102515 = DSM 9628]|uniref:Uncharacterized protein n=2 Tax=Janthinobacterium agaricidamnosum TaxID=55508 RepID=W0VBB5_9BURK|nr:hypothetical protein GJA_3941 [Janthinobacterium agaricidamnosum NBRC 102515 = DSM 9628]
MRTAFEAWAQRDGHIVRRREDKPDEYLIFETQRRWVIWQAALTHGKTAAKAPRVSAAEKARLNALRSAEISSDEASVRNKVLNEVLDAFSDIDGAAGMEGILKVIQGLKKKQRALADDKSEDSKA